MNYRHAYHAGNFADVFKHVALRLLLGAMRRKDKPFFYLDTHAGGSAYALDAGAARRTGEWATGIGRLWDAPGLSTAVGDHVAAVRDRPENAGAAEPMLYPGSGAIAQALLRDNDRSVLCDRLPEAARELKAAFAGDARIACHERDGYEALRAFLPPRERRGVVLIDPPFEAHDEFQRLGRGLRDAHRRWATGVYAAWFPVKHRDAVQAFLDGMARSGIRRQLVTEFSPLPADVPGRFNGCGLLVVNPPWGVDDELRTALSGLDEHLAEEPGRGTSRVEWLVGE